MSSLVPLLVGAALGAGLWLIVRGIIPRAVPFEAAMVEHRLNRLAGPQPGQGVLSLFELTGLGTGGSPEDLRVLSRTRSQQAFNKLTAATVGGVAPVILVIGLGVAGMAVSPIWGVGLSLVLCPVGFVFPDLQLKEQATERRNDFRRAFAAYLDLVKVLVAGGAHSDGALYQAALAGDGWPFDELRSAVDWSRVNGYAPWVGFERLSAAIGVAELSELAGSLSLADEQGASPADALTRKAESLTIHEMAEARSRADAATEQMAVPTVLIAMAFVVFLGYPALSSVAGLT